VTEPDPLDILGAAGATPEEVDEAAAHIARDPARAAEIRERAIALAEQRWPALRQHPQLIQLLNVRVVSRHRRPSGALVGTRQ